MKRLVVLGIGNPIMKDDGIAIRVAQHIKPRIADKNVEVVIGETDVSYCMDSLSDEDLLVVLDAMYIGEEPGRVRLIPLDKAVSCQIKPYSAHDLNILDAIAAEFPGIKGYLIGIEPAVVGIGFELSNYLRIRFDRICSDVEKLLQMIMEEEKNA